MTDSIANLSTFAGQLADAARTAIMPHFRANEAAPSAKDDNSPVTKADRAAEKTMREMINKNYPGHGIIGEEYGDENTGADFVWALDPIDGTRSFITGSRMFCTLVALLKDGEPVIGIIDMTALNERWLGVCQNNNEGEAFFNGKPCRVSACQSLAAAKITSTTFGCASMQQNESLKKLSAQAAYLRLGGDGEAYGALASGFADIAADASMHPHDYLALVPIVRAAGGVIGDWRGNENLNINSAKTDIIAAASTKLYQQSIAALA